MLLFIFCLGCPNSDYGMIRIQGTWESPQYQLLTNDPIHHLEVMCVSDLVDFNYDQADITWGIVSDNGLPSKITYNQVPTNTSVTYTAKDLSNLSSVSLSFSSTETSVVFFTVLSVVSFSSEIFSLSFFLLFSTIKVLYNKYL